MTWDPANPERGLGLFLRRVQRRQGWSQQYLSKITGISPFHIGRMERGVTGPPRESTWERVAKGFLVDVRRLKAVCRKLEQLERRAEELMDNLLVQ